MRFIATYLLTLAVSFGAIDYPLGVGDYHGGAVTALDQQDMTMSTWIQFQDLSTNRDIGGYGSSTTEARLHHRQQNETDTITAFADAGGGQVTVTTSGHDIVEGGAVSITGTTNYDGDYTATNVTGTTLEITATFNGDDATGTLRAMTALFRTHDGSNGTGSQSSGGYIVENVWYHHWAEADWDGSLYTSRQIWVDDGGAYGINGGDRSGVTGMNRMALGCRLTSTANNGIDAIIAHFVIRDIAYNYTNGSDAERTSEYNGLSPLQIRPDDIVGYWTLDVKHNGTGTVRDIVGGQDLPYVTDASGDDAVSAGNPPRTVGYQAGG